MGVNSRKVKISISVVFMDLKAICSGLCRRIQRHVVTCKKCVLLLMYTFACGFVRNHVIFNVACNIYMYVSLLRLFKMYYDNIIAMLRARCFLQSHTVWECV